jgi:hypothetical protein
MIEKTDAERIAAAVNNLRPDWPIGSLMTLLGNQKIRYRPYRDIAVALTWCAVDSNTRTPGRVLEDGPWWQAAATNLSKPAHSGTPRNHEMCKVDGHSGWAGNCPQCRADRLAQPTREIA